MAESEMDDAVGVRGRLGQVVQVIEVTRCTLAPSAVTAAAAVSDRARPTTSCPAAMSPGTTAEARWPDAPVTKTRMKPPGAGSAWLSK
jgi:hypothetical protein